MTQTEQSDSQLIDGWYDAKPAPAGDEFNVVVPGRERCDDWVTDMDEALEQAAAFLGLGCPVVTIEQRCRS